MNSKEIEELIAENKKMKETLVWIDYYDGHPSNIKSQVRIVLDRLGINCEVANV